MKNGKAKRINQRLEMGAVRICQRIYSIRP